MEVGPDRVLEPYPMRVFFSCAAAAALWASPFQAHGQQEISTGGLAPPPAIESQGSREEAQHAGGTEQELAAAEREDSGRGLEFFWLNGEVGGGHFGLATLSGDLSDTAQTGLVAGAGLGLRIVFITLGARFRYAPFPDWTLWTLGAEAGLHVPMGSLEPYFTLGLGYAKVAEPVRASGFDGRLGAGLDVYLTNMFTVGANLTGDVLVLSYDGPGPSSSVGAGVALTAVGGLHF